MGAQHPTQGQPSPKPPGSGRLGAYIVGALAFGPVWALAIECIAPLRGLLMDGPPTLWGERAVLAGAASVSSLAIALPLRPLLRHDRGGRVPIAALWASLASLFVFPMAFFIAMRFQDHLVEGSAACDLGVDFVAVVVVGAWGWLVGWVALPFIYPVALLEVWVLKRLVAPRPLEPARSTHDDALRFDG